MKIIDFILQNGGGGGGITPSGTITLSANGVYNVTNYASASVNVPLPSGSISISANGTYDVSAFADAIVSVSGGGVDNMKEYFAGTLQTLEYSEAKFVMASVFRSQYSLISVSLPNCSLLYDYAFANCSNLKTVSLPALTATSGNSGAQFTNCWALEEVYIPQLAVIPNQMFQYCSSLVTITANPSRLGMSVFSGCRLLQSVSFPNLTSANTSAFVGCNNLAFIDLPAFTSVPGYTFQNCYSLSWASFAVASAIGSAAFQRCYNLLSLYLPSNSVATLSNYTAFASTPISNYTTSTGGVYGSIFVPASLVDSYKAAANWSVYADRITAIV